MEKKESAFPVTTDAWHHGMSLRDYIASAAMAALSRDFKNATGISENIRNVARLNAQLAYIAADAMLEERNRSNV